MHSEYGWYVSAHVVKFPFILIMNFVYFYSGFNDNPTAQQFESAYRKLMIHNDVVCSGKSNCIDPGTKILTVSSAQPSTSSKNVDQTIELTGDDLLEDDLAVNENSLNEYFLDELQYVDDIHAHSIAYMASVLEARIIGANRFKKIVKCQECVSAFIENELLDDDFIRFKSRDSSLLQPCKSTFEICKFVDAYLKTFEGKTIPYETVALQILRRIPFGNLFVKSDFANHSSDSEGLGHRYGFVKKIVDFYMRMKSIDMAKKLTLKIHDDRLRYKYKKVIQERGE